MGKCKKTTVNKANLVLSKMFRPRINNDSNNDNKCFSLVSVKNKKDKI